MNGQQKPCSVEVPSELFGERISNISTNDATQGTKELTVQKIRSDVGEIPNTNSVLDAALSYAARGWYVFPCNPDKTPRTEHGFKNATRNPEQIRQWWCGRPSAAIGLDCGRSGVVVIDLDVKNGDGIEEWEAIKDALQIDDNGALVSQTPSGGRHLIFAYDHSSEPIGLTVSDLDNNIDTRGNGGYIILPPSQISTGEYKTLNDWQTTPAALPAALAGLLIKPTPAAPTPAPVTPRLTPATSDPWAKAAFDRECRRVETATEGNRNVKLNLAAYNLGRKIAGGYFTESEVTDALMTSAAVCGYIASDGEAAARKTIASGISAGSRRPSVKGDRFTTATGTTTTPKANTTPGTANQAQTTPSTDPPQSWSYTDTGNAARFATQKVEQVRYVAELGWLLWDGQRWQRDDAGTVMELAKEVVRGLFDESRDYQRQALSITTEIEEAAATGDDTAAAMKRKEVTLKASKDLERWAIKSSGKARIDSMLALAQSDPRISARPDAFDNDAFNLLLNCQNGVVDLRTGELLPHDPARLITRLCPVDYDPSAQCPTWDRFIKRIFNNDAAMIGFIQRAAGYSLTGSTKEQTLFFAYGNGANGKSVFTNTLLNIMGDYAQKTPVKMLTAHDSDSNGASPDLARLAGARLVIASEIEADRRLNESLVKDLTGGDRIAARFLRKEYFEFGPKFKLWIYGNHKPTIQGMDNGIWRRVKLIPFDVTIPESEQDQSLPEKLKAEYPGILSWLVTGCLDWVAGGLQEPQKVTQSTQDYRSEMDATGRFLEEQTIEGAAYWVAFADLYAAYLGWCADNGETPLNNRRFGNELTRRGFAADNGMGNKAIRRGVALLTPYKGEKGPK